MNYEDTYKFIIETAEFFKSHCDDKPNRMTADYLMIAALLQIGEQLRFINRRLMDTTAAEVIDGSIGRSLSKASASLNTIARELQDETAEASFSARTIGATSAEVAAALRDLCAASTQAK